MGADLLAETEIAGVVIPVGEFYGGIDGLNIYVKQKDPVDGTLFNVMIYNYTNGFDNASVTIADSARLFFTADKRVAPTPS